MNGTRGGWLATTARFALRLLITFNAAFATADYIRGQFVDSKAELALAVAFTALYFVLDAKIGARRNTPSDDKASGRG